MYLRSNTSHTLFKPFGPNFFDSYSHSFASLIFQTSSYQAVASHAWASCANKWKQIQDNNEDSIGVIFTLCSPSKTHSSKAIIASDGQNRKKSLSIDGNEFPKPFFKQGQEKIAFHSKESSDN